MEKIILLGLVFIVISFLPDRLINQAVQVIIAVYGKAKEKSIVVPPGYQSGKSPLGDIAFPIYVRVLFCLVGLFCVLWGAGILPRIMSDGLATPTPTPTLMPTSTPTHTPTPTSTFTPTPTPTETPSSGFGSAAAIDLVNRLKNFICDKLEGEVVDVNEKMWCRKSEFEKLRKHLEQQGKQREVFHAYQEGPVIGQNNCLWLWGKYVKGIQLEKIEGCQVCTVERWAYVPEETGKNVKAFVIIYMCPLGAIDSSPCIGVCQSLRIWRSHIPRHQWEDDPNKNRFWPTSVPPTR